MDDPALRNDAFCMGKVSMQSFVFLKWLSSPPPPSTFKDEFVTKGKVFCNVIVVLLSLEGFV